MMTFKPDLDTRPLARVLGLARPPEPSCHRRTGAPALGRGPASIGMGSKAARSPRAPSRPALGPRRPKAKGGSGRPAPSALSPLLISSWALTDISNGPEKGKRKKTNKTKHPSPQLLASVPRRVQLQPPPGAARGGRD